MASGTVWACNMLISGPQSASERLSGSVVRKVAWTVDVWIFQDSSGNEGGCGFCC